jgi:hypothetical protein
LSRGSLRSDLRNSPSCSPVRRAQALGLPWRHKQPVCRQSDWCGSSRPSRSVAHRRDHAGKLRDSLSNCACYRPGSSEQLAGLLPAHGPECPVLVPRKLGCTRASGARLSSRDAPRLLPQIQDLTIRRRSGVDSPIRRAKLDQRTHMHEVRHTRAVPHTPGSLQPPLAAALQ